MSYMIRHLNPANCVVAALTGGAVAMTLFDNLFTIKPVDGLSMQPLINSRWNRKKKDWILQLHNVNFPHSLESSVKRGDVVSLISPKDSDEIFIKRVIGLPGDIVKTINYKKKYVIVPKGHCWIEGDNYKLSNDSNVFGCIPMSLIVGKAKLLIYSHQKDILNGAVTLPLRKFSVIKSNLPEYRQLKRLVSNQNGNLSYFVDFKIKKCVDSKTSIRSYDKNEGYLSEEDEEYGEYYDDDDDIDEDDDDENM